MFFLFGVCRAKIAQKTMRGRHEGENYLFLLREYNLFYNFPAVFSLVLDGLKNSFWIYGAINLVPLLEEIGDAGSGIPDAISFLPLPEGGGRGGRGSCPPAFGTLASGRQPFLPDGKQVGAAF